jgi:cellulose synthase (UDP-forming)
LHRVWLTDLTQETVRIRGLSPPIGEKVLLGLRNVGDVRGAVIERTEEGCRISLQLDEDQHEAILRRLYSEGQAPGVTATRLSALVAEAVSRLAGR